MRSCSNRLRPSGTGGLAALVLLLAAAASAQAQQPTETDSLPDPRLLRGSSVGAALGQYFHTYPATTLQVHFSELRPGRVSPEVSLMTFPSWLVRGVLAVGADAGMAHNVAVPGATLLVRLGPSILTVPGNGGGIFGAHAGVAAIVRAGPTQGLRLEVLPRWFLGGGDINPQVGLSIGLVSLQPERE